MHVSPSSFSHPPPPLSLFASSRKRGHRKKLNGLEVALAFRDQVGGGHAVLLEHGVSRSRHAVLVHADHLSVKAHVLVPQTRHTRLVAKNGRQGGRQRKKRMIYRTI